MTTVDSQIQIITVSVATATDAKGVSPKSKDGLGSITGRGEDCEYSIDQGETYLSANGSDVSGLMPGTYSVRRAGGTNLVPSIPQLVTINAYVSSAKATPTATFEA